MMVVMNSGSIALGVPSTILWCRNTRIGISYFCFWIIVEYLNEFIEDKIPIESTIKVGDDLDIEGAMAFSAVGSKVILFVQV